MAVKQPPPSHGKRKYQSPEASRSSSLSPIDIPPEAPVIKKSKRAETRKCPVCSELIPVRLLAAHSELELDRVEDIIKSVGSTEVIGDDLEEGPSSRSRRSALRARKCLSAMNPRAAGLLDTLEQTVKVLQTIKRNRKQRHAKLREMTRDDDDGDSRAAWTGGNDGVVCPVCSQTVRGDQDVTEAHVDACLAHESSQAQLEEEALPGSWEVEVDGEARARVTDESSFRGTGFHVRDRNAQDVDEEVDIDGDDEFGEVQFTEGDILAPASDPQQMEDDEQDREVEIDGNSEDETRRQQKSLRDLVAEGKVVKRASTENSEEGTTARKGDTTDVGDADRLEQDITTAKKHGKSSTLVVALLNKIKQLESGKAASSTSPLCRICLEPYTEPTASTGCWHTCCRECWLRCLGTTKLCPICKRITAARDLRRIYL